MNHNNNLEIVKIFQYKVIEKFKHMEIYN